MSRAGQQRRLYRYAFALALVVVALFALLLLVIDRTTSLTVRLSSVGTGLMSATVFAGVFTLLANREFSELLRVEIDQHFSEHSERILTEARELNLVHLPSQRYAASSELNQQFNSDLTHDLSRSSFYWFRGTSAKYVPTRVRNSGRNLALLRVIILDPTLTQVIRRRVADRRRNPRYDGRSDEVLVEELRDEIYMAVVALFDCRDICPVEIAYASETSVVRVEMFEDALYMALYLTKQSSGQLFPEALRYSRESIHYDIYLMDCSRQYDLCERRARFAGGDTDEVLIGHLRAMGFAAAGPEELRRLRSEHRSFAARFEQSLASLTADHAERRER